MESSGGQLSITRLHSDEKSIFTAKAGGKTTIGQAESLNSFMYSGDGSLEFSKLDGKSSAFIRGVAKLKLKRASDLASLVSTDEAQAKVEKSTIGVVHTLGSKKNSFIGARVSSLNNRAKLEATDTQTTRLDNSGKATFSGNTTTEKMNNEGQGLKMAITALWYIQGNQDNLNLKYKVKMR